jgi:hypothetical protein
MGPAKTSRNTRLDAARRYLARGWSVIPAAEKGKRPIVRWQPFQNSLPSEDQLREWFDRWPEANLAVVTGAVSELVVLRGDGGVIIVPPSIHPSGKPYRWRRGHGPDDIGLATMPIWLLEPRFGGDERLGHPLAYWRSLVREGVSEGQRNATVASFTGHLLWHGVDPDVVMEMVLAWNRVRCHPPLSDEEVIRTVRSIERTHTRHEAAGGFDDR